MPEDRLKVPNRPQRFQARRGTSWFRSAFPARTALCEEDEPNYHDNSLSIRLARDMEEEACTKPD